MKKTEITPSTWSSDADYRIKNRKWLRYSSNVARRVLSILREKDTLTQLELANNIGVTPQYISKLLKGKQNLTLSTIAKLSESLGEELISFPNYKYSNRHTELVVSSGLSYDTIIQIKYDSISVFPENNFQWPIQSSQIHSIRSNRTINAEFIAK